MYSRDWSSDVCSSDLELHKNPHSLQHPLIVAAVVTSSLESKILVFLDNLNKDKGKGKMDDVLSTPSLQTSKPTSNGQLNKEPAASSSTVAKGQPSKQPKEQGKSKIFQPKYPSRKAQQSKPLQQVLVPKHQLGSRHLCQGDEYKWVERQATTSKCSSGWVSTQRSLEEQGYNKGNRLLWLPKPEFLAQKVPSTAPTTKNAQKPQQHNKK